MSQQNDTPKEFRFPCYVNEEHVYEMDDYVHKQRQLGRKGHLGRPYNRNDYIIEALEEYAKITGLKTSPKR